MFQADYFNWIHYKLINSICFELITSNHLVSSRSLNLNHFKVSFSNSICFKHIISIQFVSSRSLNLNHFKLIISIRSKQILRLICLIRFFPVLNILNVLNDLNVCIINKIILEGIGSRNYCFPESKHLISKSWSLLSSS